MARREYIVYFRGPADTPVFYLSTRDAVRDGNKYIGLLTAIPEPVDNPLNDFGIQGGGGFTLEIADYAEAWPGVTSGYALLLEGGDNLLLEDGGRILLEG